MGVQKQLDWLYGLERFGVKPGLERMEAMMELMGHPERQFKAIHISGTNGKGSVAAMVDTILRVGGERKYVRRIGLYTSPHLYRFNERIRVDGEEISDEDLARLTQKLRGIIEAHDIPATFFEFTTALAFIYFAEVGVDVAVVEVGMGGLLDATNVVEPLLSVITNIGLDHTEYLGDTKEQIAREKSGIIKRGAPLVTAERDERLLTIMREQARGVGSRVYEVNDCVSPTVASPAGGDVLGPQHITVEGVFAGELLLPLLGAHQVTNAMTAVTALYVLTELGFAYSWRDIQRGMEAVEWPGRLDVVSRNPLILVDGAHNNDGVEALYVFVKDLPRHDVLVLGEKKGKDMDVMATQVVPLFDRVIVTKGVYMPQEPQTIADALRESGYAGEIVCIDSADTAMAQARAYTAELLKTSQNIEPVILVSGSLYLVADVLMALRSLRS